MGLEREETQKGMKIVKMVWLRKVANVFENEPTPPMTIFLGTPLMCFADAAHSVPINLFFF